MADSMLSIVIPAYNEADNIGETLAELIACLEDCLPAAAGGQFEIIVVDDHSDDGTFQAVEGASDPRVACIRLSRRCGSHTALRAGLKQASGDAVICVSADGQDDPTALPAMLARWRAGAHIVWALRQTREDERGLQRLFSGWFYKLLQRMADPGANQSAAVDLSRADFYLLDRRVVDAVNGCPERNTSLFGLIAWSGFRQEAVEYVRRPRRHGQPKWSFGSRFRLAKDWIIAFSGLPLRLMTIFGFLVAAFGFLYAVVLFFRAFYGEPLPGWSSLMVVVLVLGGLQAAMLGVIGEYLWRTLDEARNRGLYFIETSTFERRKIMDDRHSAPPRDDAE